MSKLPSLIVAAAFAVVGSATFAQSASTESYSVGQLTPVAVTASANRVQPAMAASRDTATYSVAQVDGVAKAVAASQAEARGLTREQVRAEFFAARRNGESNPFDNDPYVNVPSHVSGASTVAAAGRIGTMAR